jgi:hypothetical protein
MPPKPRTLETPTTEQVISPAKTKFLKEIEAWVQQRNIRATQSRVWLSSKVCVLMFSSPVPPGFEPVVAVMVSKTGAIFYESKEHMSPRLRKLMADPTTLQLLKQGYDSLMAKTQLSSPAVPNPQDSEGVSNTASEFWRRRFH